MDFDKIVAAAHRHADQLSLRIDQIRLFGQADQLISVVFVALTCFFLAIGA